MTAAPLVEARNVSRDFRQRTATFGRSRKVPAVSSIDLEVARGETLGVVGESGCGKSTLGRMLLGLLPPSAGSILFDGRDLSAVRGADRRGLRRRMQMIFQDPYGSLDPRRRVGAQIADGLELHRIVPRKGVADEVERLLAAVGLDGAAALRRPHEFSGGQRQRIAIARAVAVRPDFIVADEPVSALDVSVQAQIVSLLAELRASLGLSMLLISHDLHVVRKLSDRVAVMYLGRIVEEGAAGDVFSAPAHPYTRALLEATPSMSGGWLRDAEPLRGDLPSPATPPSGCVFRTRCPIASAECATTSPRLAQYERSQRVACIRPVTDAGWESAP